LGFRLEAPGFTWLAVLSCTPADSTFPSRNTSEVVSRSVLPRLSLVIPAYNEAQFLPRLLDSVEEARRRFRDGAGAVEVIVADNASTDPTSSIAGERGCHLVQVPRRAIAAARNGGARAARGEILAFVDADSEIHPQTFNEIDRALNGGRAVAGATGVRLERLSLGIAATYGVMVLMVWATGMDTGVVFCRRADFEAIGGYDERLLFGEDVCLLLALRRLGRSQGQRLVRLRSVKALGSTRKFDELGDWHYFGLLGRAVLWLFNRRFDTFVRSYWYDVRPSRQAPLHKG
jgi:glycosyltransferase involved in cell wall biosynthesis